MLITSHKLLIAWYDAAAAYADDNQNNNRRNFDRALQAADPLFTAAFTNDALPIFEKARITPNATFAVVLNAIRGNGPRTVNRLEQQELLIAVYLDDPVSPKEERPNRGDAFKDAGLYLKDTNPRASKEAFISHWAKTYGINRKEASAMLDESLKDLERFGVGEAGSDFPEYTKISVQVAELDTVLQSLGDDDVFPIQAV